MKQSITAAKDRQNIDEDLHDVNVQVESGKNILLRADLHRTATHQELCIVSQELNNTEGYETA